MDGNWKIVEEMLRLDDEVKELAEDKIKTIPKRGNMISLYRRISTSPPLIFLDEGGHDSNKGGVFHF